MHWIAVLALAGCAASPELGHPVQPRTIAAPAREPAAGYPLHPTVRWLIAGHVMLDIVGREVLVPYYRGLTLRGALRIGGAARAMKARGTLTRNEREDAADYDVPVGKILRYEAPDPELAPGDKIVVECESSWGCH